MWARNLELSLGFWLAASPFVFGHPAGAEALWINDLACAALVVVLSLVTYWPPLSRAHLAELAVAAWLVGFGWMAGRDVPTPASQNHMLVGLVLGMLAVVPTQASRPPPAWRKTAERELPAPRRVTGSRGHHSSGGPV